ncbi:MAG: CRISPR-associated protein [Cyanobacteria bacterium CRU_2_1]|nr:CRISPR-associated protein [Cyanobacteria bacterium CRU_2_1]
MRNTLSQAIQILFNPETILPFLVGSVFLAIFGNAAYDIFKNIFGDTTPDLVKIGAIALLILVAAVLVVAWVITQRLSHLPIDIPFEVQQKALDRQYPGLILLVSKVETCETAIRFHGRTLKRCWLICSPQTLEQAQELRQQFPQVCVDQPIVVNDIYNPLEFRACISAIYHTRLPKSWQESDVIADYTGMTAHASVGTVLACVGTTRPLQYTPAKVDAQGKIVGSLNPIRVILNWQQQSRGAQSKKAVG